MEFSEASAEWREIPEWANSLIEFGFRWISRASSSRRIAVISMPSDSAAAGLVTLGAMRKCLELDDANDLGSHFQRIVSLARNGTRGIFLRHAERAGRYEIDGVDNNGNLWVKKVPVTTGLRISITRNSSVAWRFDGEAPVAVLHGRTLPNATFYEHLVRQGGTIKASNLAESDSGICLAGRSMGESSTKNSMAAIRFRDNGCETDLRQLLTVQNWMPGTISRVMFFNARTDEFDRGSGRPHLVIADGDASFLKVASRKEFEQSDVVGVIHRTMEREKLEEVGNKLASLRQWYDPDTDAVADLPAMPPGITIAVLKRST